MSKDEVIEAVFDDELIVVEDSKAAKALYDQSRFGELKNNKIQYSLVEAMYLLSKGKLVIKKGRKNLSPEDFMKLVKKKNKNFWVRFMVFKDMRQRGYIVKTALKFGADFRIYDRGIKPGEDHAKWIVFPVHETETLTWYDFSAKNRVAHSTKKRLLLGIVDEEGDVVYYECKWTRP